VFSNKAIHIIGGGGVGMSGLALLAQRAGASVSASDKSDSPYLQKLTASGMATWVGSHPERIQPGAHVFYSTAIKADDEERSFAERMGWPCESRHSLLKSITSQYYTIAIAGCHGKTTTSAWVADLLVRAGADPTALIGGTVPTWGSNYRQGNGTQNGRLLLVVEADESDKSFLSIESMLALITNIDLDHTDVHANLESLKQDFEQFAEIARKNGGQVILSKESDEKIPVRLDTENHQLIFGDRKYAIGLAGAHNLMNATLVLQLGFALQIDDAVIKESLAEFTGVNRRMQRIGERNGVVVIDDYAHHPREIEATLAALEKQYDKLLIFWEPHRLSRFVFFADEFERVLSRYASMHSVFVLPIFASGDRAEDYPEVAAKLDRFRAPPFTYLNSIDESPEPHAEVGKCAAVFMGAGLSSDYATRYVILPRVKS